LKRLYGSPTIEVDGVPRWGSWDVPSVFELPPGWHRLRLHYGWIFRRGLSETWIDLVAGARAELVYRAPRYYDTLTEGAIDRLEPGGRWVRMRVKGPSAKDVGKVLATVAVFIAVFTTAVIAWRQTADPSLFPAPSAPHGRSESRQ
jgi:hypothetical protein